jgi:hypothetical protein
VAAVITNNHDHQDGMVDRKSCKATTESPLAKKWVMGMTAALAAIRQHLVFGDFIKLPEWRKALPTHWV